VTDILLRLTEEIKNEVQGQFLSRREPFEIRRNPGHDPATIKSYLLTEFDKIWSTYKFRINIIPGKQVLAMLNKYLQVEYKVSITTQTVVSAFRKNEIPDDIRNLIETLDDFRTQRVEHKNSG
jgi:hypothetical protein